VLPLVPRPDRDNGARVATSTDGIRPGEALRAELGDLLRYDLPALLGAARAMEEA